MSEDVKAKIRERYKGKATASIEVINEPRLHITLPDIPGKADCDGDDGFYENLFHYMFLSQPDAAVSLLSDVA